MTESLSIDQAFIRKLSDIMLANLQNENFGVNEFAREAGLSRSFIHRRLRAIRNQNISQFIREIRLKRAMELLQQRAGAASEVAYQVGFGSPAYFNKCFHEYYGYPPGEVKKRILPEDGVAIEPAAKDAVESKQSQADAKAAPFTVFKLNRKRIILVFTATIVMFSLAWVLYNHLIKGKDLLNDYNRQEKDLSIVVLPFKNFSDDPHNQYFADGIMEDILNNLFRISDLRVISRTTSEHYRETSLTAKEIARQLNARNVLEGSVRRYGDKARISVQLIDAYRDHHIWSANFDRELKDIIGIQSDIALKVANKLNAVLSDKEIRQIGKIPTQNPEAYDNYLRGRFLLHKANSEQRYDFDKEGVMGCLQYFEKAIAADTNFADAYAGLANAWFNLSAWGWLPIHEGFPKARDFSMKALEIEPDCAEAHTVKGAYLIWPERRFEEGRKEFQTSLQLNPNFPTTHQWYAQLLMITGPLEEARLHINRAVELEPYFWVVQNLDAWVYYFEEKYDKAIEACLIARDLKPNFLDNNWLLFLNYAKLGEGEKAAEELQTIVRTYPSASNYTDEIWEAYSKSGVKGLFSWLIDVNIHKPVPVEGMTGHPFYIAWWNAILGNKEESVYWLQRNMEAKYRLYTYFNLMATNPDFDILRNDPRFLAIIEEIGLAPYHTRKAK